MINDITFSYPSWYIILCVVAGLLYAAILYSKDRKFDESPKWSKWAMAFLRFIGVTSIALLLLSPVLKSNIEEVKKPIIVIAEDGSQSVTNKLSPEEITQQLSSIEKLSSDLAERYEVKRLSFGDEVTEGKVDSFSSQVTNLSSVLEYIDDNYGDQNLGAVVLATDGIYNEGRNPLYAQSRFSAPVYSIALGDTMIGKDLVLKNVFHNKIAYLNDKFTIQVDISALNAAGLSTNMTVRRISIDGNQTLHTENIRIKDNDFFNTKEITLSADRPGVIHYRIGLTTIDGELNTTNNYKDIYVEILDARQKILILSDGPHPDMAAFNRIISGNKNYEVTTEFANDKNRKNISTFDLVIFHNLPSNKYNLSTDLTMLNKRKTPRLFVVGASTSISKLNKVQSVMSINGKNNLLENIQADIVPSFNDFTISDILSKSLVNFPPLNAPFGEYKTEGNAKTLLTQRIKKIKTSAPMLSFSSLEGYNTAVWIGEGLWRWQLYDYLQHKNYDIVTELVNKTIQLISKKEDKRKFRVNNSENIYKENEDILFDAQLYNTSYEMINEPDVTLTITDEKKDKYNFTFSRVQNYYALNAKRFPAGNYTYRSEVDYNGEKLTQSGKFSVQNIQLEYYDLTARHGLLRNLSLENGGLVYQINQIDSLSTAILANDKIKPVVFNTSKTMSVLNYKWLFFIIFFFLIAEWFMRRYMGSY